MRYHREGLLWTISTTGHIATFELYILSLIGSGTLHLLALYFPNLLGTLIPGHARAWRCMR